MGIFKKRVKEKSKFDCMGRPIEWYSDPAQQEVYEYYVTQSKVEDFMEVKDQLSRVDLEISGVKAGDAMNPWRDPVHYFYNLLINYHASLMCLVAYMVFPGKEQGGTAALKDPCIYIEHFAVKLLTMISDESGDGLSMKYPDVVMQSKNPILNYLLRLNNEWMALTIKYNKIWELSSYMKAAKNVLKISYVMLGYFYESYAADGSNESDSDWMYDESLYLLPGKDGVDGYPEARSFQNVCAQVRKKIVDPEHWDKVLEELSSDLKYMDSMCV